MAETPRPNIIAVSAPWRWLAAGWRDMRANPIASLAYGLLFAIAGDVLLLTLLPYPHLFSLAVSGFFLVAPLLAAGLYEISRRQERGLSSRFLDSLGGWRRNGEAIALFGVALALVGILWERISAILFALLYDRTEGVAIGVTGFLRTVVFSGAHMEFVLSWISVGACLAAVVFAFSATTIPMMIDRPTRYGGDPVAAAWTSARAVFANVLPMALWAALLVALTLIGFATFLFGLILIMPILGHASWHAYRELIPLDPDAPSEPMR